MKRETENETRRGRKGDLEGIREEGGNMKKRREQKGRKQKWKKKKRTRGEN